MDLAKENDLRNIRNIFENSIKFSLVTLILKFLGIKPQKNKISIIAFLLLFFGVYLSEIYFSYISSIIFKFLCDNILLYRYPKSFII